VTVIGVGNAWRRDDGAGLAVARRLRALGPAGIEVRAHEGEASGLLDAWAGADHVVLVDAASSGAVAGTVHRFDVVARPLAAGAVRSSTHAFGVPDAIELARALGSLPATLEVYAIEGADFAVGGTMTPAVADAADSLARELASALV
jgi:hydrogenase maturation protease